MKQIRRHVTYANVMSSLAVFLILGGATAFAAVKKVGPNEIKANSIKTGKIVKEAVTAGKIKKAAVTESRIADGAVTTNKLADNAVTTGKIANDAVTGAKLATNAVSNAKLENASVNGSKVADRSLSANDVTQASGQVTYNFGNLTPGLCDYALVSSGLPDLTGFLLFASPGNAGAWPSAVIVDPYLSNIAGSLRVRACNVGTAASDPPSTTFNWAVMQVG